MATPTPASAGTTVIALPLASVTAASTVRSGIDLEHVTRLVAVLDRCPPITVTSDGRLIDGAHRIEAARRLGWDTIPARIVPLESSADVVLAAASANSRHGLPLSRLERRNAVEELLRVSPGLSDRRIAAACGVARSVVAGARSSIEACSGGRSDRIGADGKRYPSAPTAAEPLAEAHLRVRPDLTVRELARLIGVSTGTAQRMRRSAIERIQQERPWTRWARRLLARWRLWSARRHGRSTR